MAAFLKSVVIWNRKKFFRKMVNYKSQVVVDFSQLHETFRFVSTQRPHFSYLLEIINLGIEKDARKSW